MKILYIDTNNIFGGGQIMVLRLLDCFHEKEQPSVICSSENQKFISELKKRDVEIIPLNIVNLKTENKILKAIFQIPNFIKSNIAISNIIKKYNPDIILSNLFYSSILAIIPAKIRKKPIIMNIYIRENLLKYKPLSRFIINNIERTIFPTQELIEIAKSIGIKDNKIGLIRVGIKMEDLSFGGPLIVNGIEVQHPIVAMIGRFDREQKGHQYFIEAAEIVSKKYPEARFLISGGAVGEQEEAWEKEVKNDVLNRGIRNIVFAGFYPNLSELMSKIDIVAIPSLYESIPAVAVEALFLKKPVVATNVGGLPEIIIEGKTGILIPPKDSQKLAERIIYLLDNPKIASMLGANGKELVDKEFSLELMTKKYGDLYHKVIKEHDNRN